MATNNLRIIYQNLADLSTATVTANTTANATTTPASNMQKDIKSQVWRSGTFTSNLTTCTSHILVNLGTTQTGLGGVVLPFCNLTSTATIRVRAYTGSTISFTGSTPDSPTFSTTGATLVFDTGAVLACPYQVLGNWNWGVLELGANFYSYGGGTYARIWIPPNTTGIGNSFNQVLITIVDDRSAETNKYIEASRVVLGKYWEPKYNTSFGLSTTIKDLSAHQRTESGDLITNRGVRFNSMNFDLKWLTSSDRLDLTRILKGNGLSRPIFISLFPDDSDTGKEQAHQIYGKLSQSSPIQHPIFETYSTQIEIEEL